MAFPQRKLPPEILEAYLTGESSAVLAVRLGIPRRTLADALRQHGASKFRRLMQEQASHDRTRRILLELTGLLPDGPPKSAQEEAASSMTVLITRLRRILESDQKLSVYELYCASQLIQTAVAVESDGTNPRKLGEGATKELRKVSLRAST